jgi:hypothetical protein
MLRKTLAVLLFGTCINLSGVGLAQDLELPGQARVHITGNESAPRVDLANDLLESAEFTTFYNSAIFQPPDVSLYIDRLPVDKKASPIYKLLRVFLI